MSSIQVVTRKLRKLLTKVCQYFKGKLEVQQTSSLVHDLDLEELFVSIIVYCTET